MKLLPRLITMICCVLFVKDLCCSVCVFSNSLFLRQSFLEVHILTTTYQKALIHVLKPQVLCMVGFLSFHDIGPQGPCPVVGLEVKN